MAERRNRATAATGSSDSSMPPTTEELRQEAEAMSVRDLRGAVVEFGGAEALRGLLEKKDLVEAYVQALDFSARDEEGEELMQWAYERPVSELLAALEAMGFDRRSKKAWSKQDLAGEYVRFVIFEGKTDPTAAHEDDNCYNCAECRKRRKQLRREAKEKRRAACATCGAPAMMKCSKCELSSFCSRECQVAAWPAHKAVCKRRCERDAMVATLLGKHNPAEYCVHYANFKKVVEEEEDDEDDEASAAVVKRTGSFDLYKGACLTLDPRDYDDKTSGVCVAMHFANKAPGRLDDQHCLLYNGSRWAIVGLGTCRDCGPDWPVGVLEELHAKGGFTPELALKNDDDDVQRALGIMSLEDRRLYSSLLGGLEHVYNLAARGICDNVHCRCDFNLFPQQNQAARRRGNDGPPETNSTSSSPKKGPPPPPPSNKKKTNNKKKNKKKK